MRWKGVNLPCVSSSKPIQVKTQITSKPRPSTRPATRTPRGRQVCGRATGSEPAGMDVGEEDAAGADLEELVHESLGAGARDHRPHRRPPVAMERRDRGAL